MHNKKLKVFSRTLFAFSIHVYFSKIRSCKPGCASASPVTRFYARLLVFGDTLSQPPFAVVNCSEGVMSVFYFPVLIRSLIFLQL